MAAVAVAAAIIVYVVVVSSVAPIQARGPSSWWFRQDVARATYAEADGARQTTVPIRSGQLQGLVVTLYNPTDRTQTILGQWQGSNAPAMPGARGSPWPPRDQRETSGPCGTSGPAPSRPTSPGGCGLMWISNACLEGKGTSQGNDELRLQVRIGWADRVENIPLRQGWFVSGPSQGPCY